MANGDLTPDELDQFWAALYRLRAQAYRLAASRDELNATAIEATAAMRRFIAAFTEAEASEIAEHPDLAELNVQLDGFYGT
jgi:hypothetical protein